MRLKTLNQPVISLLGNPCDGRVESSFKAVQSLIKHITALPDRDGLPASDNDFCIVKSLAEENGFRSFQTPEEFAISAAMKDLKVGPRTAHYGWRLYKRYRSTGAFDTGAINY